MVKVTWDGKGLNDAGDPYRERVATFNAKYAEHGPAMERAVNAHAALVGALREGLNALADIQNSTKGLCYMTENCDMTVLDAMRAALRLAESK